MNTFVIAEIGVNHNGSIDLAKQLIDVAVRVGASAAKFQTFTADSTVVPNTQAVAYQSGSSNHSNQHELLRSLELNTEQYSEIAIYCAEVGIEFMSTAFDIQSLDLLCGLGIKRIKIPSGEVTNLPYVKACARKGLPIILSTGMASMDEVELAVNTIRAERPNDDGSRYEDGPSLVVLHCTSSYPTEIADVNLKAMVRMGEKFGVDIGYSDHTAGTFVSPIAVALGATVIEKHLTLDRSMDGPDHSASIEPTEFRNMIQSISAAEQLLGNGEKSAQASELEARALVRRGIKARRDLAKGTILSEQDVDILRPETGLPPSRLGEILGKRINADLAAGEPIEGQHIRHEH